jgi:exodeoxyribonuclease V alpha subunit
MSIADAEQAADRSADVFGQFCAAGLWPGLGRSLAAQLPAAGITGPEQVSPARLQKLDGVGPKRAQRLAASFEDALPSYDTAEVLVSCRVPARYAAAAVGYLGKSAAVRLREDPWLLLSLPQIQPDQADWFARRLLGDQAHPQDPRRGRALVVYLLTRAARDGHTAVPADVILRSVSRFRIDDPAAAVAAAVEDGSVLPFGEPGPEPGAEPGAPAGESAVLLALARYALAEEAIA